MADDVDDSPGSSPCFAHELVGGRPVDPETARDVARFRKAERERLLTLRQAMPQDERAGQAEVIARQLDRVVQPGAGKVIAVYWPIRSELDLRGWMASVHETGARVVLPVVIEARQPLEFREWTPRCKMARGVWNIPVPESGARLTPDVVISPVLGVDSKGYRLGNGGGYYDRVLADLDPKPLIIGIGQNFTRLKTIFPMPWDVPMDMTVLGDGTVWHQGDGPLEAPH